MAIEKNKNADSTETGWGEWFIMPTGGMTLDAVSTRGKADSAFLQFSEAVATALSTPNEAQTRWDLGTGDNYNNGYYSLLEHGAYGGATNALPITLEHFPTDSDDPARRLVFRFSDNVSMMHYTPTTDGQSVEKLGG